jgi:hypothetical protein
MLHIGDDPLAREQRWTKRLQGKWEGRAGPPDLLVLEDASGAEVVKTRIAS